MFGSATVTAEVTGNLIMSITPEIPGDYRNYCDGELICLFKINMQPLVMSLVNSSGSRRGGGGGLGGHAPWLVNSSYKKMAADLRALYFVFLGPPSPNFLDKLLVKVILQCEFVNVLRQIVAPDLNLE